MNFDADDEDTLLGLAIGAIILGLGFSMLFIRNFTGDGAVVLSIGLMTLAIVIAIRSEKAWRVKRETALPQRQPEPTKPVITPSQSVENIVTQSAQTTNVAQSQLPQKAEPIVTEAVQQPQPSSEAPKKEEEPIAATPS